jgi:hypothetical protein
MDGGDIRDHGWVGLTGVQSAGQATEVECDLEQAGQLDEAEQGVWLALLMASHRQTADSHRKLPAGQLAFDGAPCAWPGQGRMIRLHVGRRLGRRGRPINLVQNRPPAFYPAVAFEPLAGFAIHHRGIEEPRGKPGEPSMAPVLDSSVSPGSTARLRWAPSPAHASLVPPLRETAPHSTIRGPLRRGQSLTADAHTRPA